MEFLEQIKKEAAEAAQALAAEAKLSAGNIVVIGWSSSEVAGNKIGTASSPETAEAIYEGLDSIFRPLGIYIAAQCCEHLNRAIVTEAAAVPGAYRVNVVPQPKAGGSFATTAYKHAEHPVVLENIQADAGLDIGGTLIGMHLKPVAVPVRLPVRYIGNAILLAARTRPKFIGGIRAVYDEGML